MLVALASKTAVLSTRDMAVATTTLQTQKWSGDEQWTAVVSSDKTSSRRLWLCKWVTMIWSGYTSLKFHKVFPLPVTAFCSGACPCNVMHGSFMTLWSWLASGFHDAQHDCFQWNVHSVMKQKFKLTNFTRQITESSTILNLKWFHSFVTLCGRRPVSPRPQLCTVALPGIKALGSAHGEFCKQNFTHCKTSKETRWLLENNLRKRTKC